MNSKQIESLQLSWQHATPIAETVVRLFYRRLFELSPELRERFHTSMSEQSDHLLAAIHDLVQNAGRTTFVASTRVDSKVCQPFEAHMTDAWLWALEQEIGRCASKGACDAWREAIKSDAGVTFKLVALGEVMPMVA